MWDVRISVHNYVKDAANEKMWGFYRDSNSVQQRKGKYKLISWKKILKYKGLQHYVILNISLWF